MNFVIIVAISVCLILAEGSCSFVRDHGSVYEPGDAGKLQLFRHRKQHPRAGRADGIGEYAGAVLSRLRAGTDSESDGSLCYYIHLGEWLWQVCHDAGTPADTGNSSLK